MTGVGVLLGTAAYMSPEQARGTNVDRRADLWAFGCVLYEMLTGATLFEGHTVSDTIAHVLTKPIVWTALPLDTPVAVRRLLRRCLERDRHRRLADAGAARIEIDDPGVESEQSSSHAASTASKRARTWLPWALVAVMAGLLTTYASLRTQQAARSPAVRLTLSTAGSVVFTNSNQQLLEVSQDGADVVYVANRQLYRRRLSEFDARPIVGTDLGATVRNPAFSPDGQFIAFFSNANTSTPAGGTLKKIPVGGGMASTICPAAQPRGVSWTADGLVFGQVEGIVRANEATATCELILKAQPGEELYHPQLLPGGEALIFTAQRTVDISGDDRTVQDSARTIVGRNLKTGEQKVLVRGGADGRYVASGHLIYASQGIAYAVAFEPHSLSVAGAAQPVIEGVARTTSVGGSEPIAQLSVSANGTLVYLEGSISARAEMQFAWLDRERGTLEPLPVPAGSYVAPRLSPDGTRIAAGAQDSADIWILDPAGTRAPRRLTFGGKSRFPVWSPDGRRVAFQSDRNGPRGVFAQNVDGSGTVEALTSPTDEAAHIPYSWSSDGRHLLFAVVQGRHAELWDLDLATHRSAKVSGSESDQLPNGTFSPDGRWIAYVVGRQGRNVFVQPFPPTGAVYQVSRTETSGSNPFWSPDSRELFFARGPGDAVAVRITSEGGFGMSNPEPVPWGGRASSGSQRECDIARDGKRFLVMLPTGGDGLVKSDIRVVLNWFEELRRVGSASPR